VLQNTSSVTEDVDGKGGENPVKSSNRTSQKKKNIEGEKCPSPRNRATKLVGRKTIMSVGSITNPLHKKERGVKKKEKDECKKSDGLKYLFAATVGRDSFKTPVGVRVLHGGVWKL